MDRLVEVVIRGETRYLNYSIEVMFRVIEKYGSAQKMLEALLTPGVEAFETVRWLAALMANDGELCRREAGFEKNPMLSVKDISPRMKPWEYERLHKAVSEAVSLGYQREVEDDDTEIDLGLEELNKKKETAGV